MKLSNGYGGFSDDGKEYIITLKEEEKTPAPWVNVLANEKFGTIVSESGGGWTWFENSREFKLTEWFNDPILDPRSENITINDINIADGTRTVTHGCGWTRFEREHAGIRVSATVFVPRNRSCKVTLLNITNISDESQEVTVKYDVTPALGVSSEFTSHYIKQQERGDYLVYTNPFASEAWMNAEVYKTHNIPRIVLNPGEMHRFVLELGTEVGGDPDAELEEVKQFWQEIAEKTAVKTGDKANDILLGGWMMYQAISSRIFARSGYYQAGGAFGFRDQLQDTLAISGVLPELARKQIILAAAHQFREGDVQHWFHLPRHGVRTRFSDDYLWLPYCVMEYVRATGDKQLWDEEVAFLTSPLLAEGENERYEIPDVTEETATIREHCRRAIALALTRIGSNGLPLIGGGDWNDGFSAVGIKNKGESVWLAWFLIDILQKWGGFEDESSSLKKAVNAVGWDGEWFIRAIMDDGTKLGSKDLEECEIDAIAQAWAVISGGGEKEKCDIAMRSVVDRLVDKEHNLIKLLDPPFSKINAGYISSYTAGVRENGGQYTHAAAWVILALHRMGRTAEARELFSMINPINHSDTKEKAEKYKLEPYVVAADVYTAEGFEGMGGWSWYTGAAGWMQRVGEEIFGDTDI